MCTLGCLKLSPSTWSALFFLWSYLPSGFPVPANGPPHWVIYIRNPGISLTVSHSCWSITTSHPFFLTSFHICTQLSFPTAAIWVWTTASLTPKWDHSLRCPLLLLDDLPRSQPECITALLKALQSPPTVLRINSRLLARTYKGLLW